MDSRRLAPCGTSISFFSFVNLTLGMRVSIRPLGRGVKSVCFFLHGAGSPDARLVGRSLAGGRHGVAARSRRAAHLAVARRGEDGSAEPGARARPWGWEEPR